ncbi:MAG: hypothetical protein JXA03_06680 [Bacteroidales bacterium]|nr:hypothetical protein [Bacteroidales bacterium]
MKTTMRSGLYLLTSLWFSFILTPFPLISQETGQISCENEGTVSGSSSVQAISINIQTDKNSYLPGEQVTLIVDITTKDASALYFHVFSWELSINGYFVQKQFKVTDENGRAKLSFQIPCDNSEARSLLVTTISEYKGATAKISRYIPLVYREYFIAAE